MYGKKFNENSKGMRLVQHILFAALSFFILLKIFSFNNPPAPVDYIYTSLFIATILPVVYLHLYWLLPRLSGKMPLLYYFAPLLLITAVFVWINEKLFSDWSATLFPNYFFISYYKWWEIALFFVVMISVTALLKLSKSWFVVTRLQRKLLETEKQRVQEELKALKAQINPHFFFNTLNSIYSMSLDRDERLPGTVLQLSELMRYFLYESKEDMVPLAREIQVLKDYIALQSIRSDEKLKMGVALEGDFAGQKIAPLLLITFVENSFKHGAKGEAGTAYINLLIKLTGSKLNFKLTNNKGTIDEIEKPDHKGLGLENVKRRLELIYPEKYKLDIQDTGVNFTVNLQLDL